MFKDKVLNFTVSFVEVKVYNDMYVHAWLFYIMFKIEIIRNPKGFKYSQRDKQFVASSRPHPGPENLNCSTERFTAQF